MLQVIKKRLQYSVFREVYEIFKSTFFYRTSPAAASENEK